MTCGCAREGALTLPYEQPGDSSPSIYALEMLPLPSRDKRVPKGLPGSSLLGGLPEGEFFPFSLKGGKGSGGLWDTGVLRTLREAYSYLGL